jgi:hypothetical protein
MSTIKGFLYFLLACIVGGIGISIMTAGALIGIPLLFSLGIFGVFMFIKEARDQDSTDL